VLAQEIAPNCLSAWFFEPGTFRPMAKVENGKAYACVTDQVGTPRELLTSDGKLAWSAKFAAFGALDGVKASETDCPIRFQGQWFDSESGLHYNWNRYYDPETGKYLSSDPIGLSGGTRSYAYVHNPLTWVDPWGLSGSFGSGKPPHTATVTVTDSEGNLKYQDVLTSGNMTPEEAALGFPKSTLATHTEARATSQIPLDPGDQMLIQGEYPPCTSCRGKMNARAAETGAGIEYTWTEDGDLKSWTAKGVCK
jgi:RHS repeat-associated protein